jgi:hypothetical protein
MTVPAAAVASPEHETSLQLFVSLSATLTGFTRAELWGTGMVPSYYAVLPSIIGDSIFGRFLTRWRDTYIRGAGTDDELDALVVSQMADDPEFGPLTRNLASMWYLGVWNQLPADWRNVHGAWAGDVTFVVSKQAFIEGLVWKAMHTHPKGAKQPGFGSWALPPQVDSSH